MKISASKWPGNIGHQFIAPSLIGASLVVALVVLFAVKKAEAIDGKPLSQAEVTQLSAEALGGDGLAAQRLSGHFGIAENKLEERYWYRIAVENGAPEAKQSFASQLWLSGGFRNCTRALHLYDEVLQLSKNKNESEFFKLTREQRDDMRKNLPKCVSQRCSKMVEDAWCD